MFGNLNAAARSGFGKLGLTLVAAILLVMATSPLRAQSAEWKEGLRIGSDSVTTGTLRITLGKKVGTLQVENVDGKLEMGLLNTKSGIPEPLKVKHLDDRSIALGEERQLPTDKMDKTIPVSFAIRGGSVGAETAVFDFSVTGPIDPVALVRLSTDREITSSTLTLESNGLQLDGPTGEAVYFKMVAPQPFRQRMTRGFRMVAPMREGTRARLAISTRKMTDQEINALAVPAPPAAIPAE